MTLLYGRRGRLGRLWMLLTINLVFCASSLIIWRTDPRLALVTLTFFGGGAGLFAMVILRKRRERRFKAHFVQVAGGVKIPVMRRRQWMFAVYLMALGGALGLGGVGRSLMICLLGALAGLCGIVLLVVQRSGLLSRSFLLFLPEGLIFGALRYELQLPWDAIREVRPIEYADNPFVGLRFANLDMIQVTPAAQRNLALKHIRETGALMGVDLAVPTQHFGLEVPIFVAALRRYIEEPTSRQELAPRAQIASAPAYQKGG